MKILSYKVENDMVVVSTDSNNDDFVYEIDKFDSFESLEKEILKKIGEISKKKAKKAEKLDKLFKGLNDKVK